MDNEQDVIINFKIKGKQEFNIHFDINESARTSEGIKYISEHLGKLVARKFEEVLNNG